MLALLVHLHQQEEEHLLRRVQNALGRGGVPQKGDVYADVGEVRLAETKEGMVSYAF